MFQFEIEAVCPDTNARAGKIYTDHGIIETPIFMPVGTVASVKGITQEQLHHYIQAQIILANTYHLFLRPSMEVLSQAKGLHRFMNWNKPILTDSGGYQIFSIASRRKITQEGVQFSSHIDGSKYWFTPESVIEAQRIIGSDIQMVLDECTPYPCEFSYAKKSLALTHNWVKRAFSHINKISPAYSHTQALFPIVQGSTFPELRRESASFITELNAYGNAIGGLSVGEPAEMMYDITEIVCEILPTTKPRYLMGVGTPQNIVESIARGIDMMDCVLPSRNARHGILYSYEGVLNIKNNKFKYDFSPIDPNSTCSTDLDYSRAYLRHLFVAGELLALTLASIHNLHFYLQLASDARKHILEGTFAAWKRDVVEQLGNRI